MINYEQCRELAERLVGTTLDLDTACEQIGLEEQDASELESMLLDHNVERCQGCGWWCNTSELAPDGETDEGEGLCDDCKEET